MKKFFTLFLPVFLCLHASFAQTNDVTEALQVTQRYYQNLDKTRLETGFLMDLAPPLENIDFVNGRSSDTLIANMTHFGLLYAMCMLERNIRSQQ